MIIKTIIDGVVKERSRVSLLDVFGIYVNLYECWL